MNPDGYRTRERKLVLPEDGHCPEGEFEAAPHEQEAFLEWIACQWQLIDTVSAAHRTRTFVPQVLTATETWLGCKRWFLSHHLFIPFLALTGYCLKRSTEIVSTGRCGLASEWVRLAASLRRGCGSLFLYSIDFSPSSDIYRGEIRRSMPQAFSGYEIRERHFYFQPAMASFLSAVNARPDCPVARQLFSEWLDAEQVYRDLHVRCMKQAVPAVDPSEIANSTPKSLRQEYKETHGSAPKVSEESFETYDSWFAIERAAEVTPHDYALQICDIGERVLADLLMGHRLDRAVVRDLLDAMRSALTIVSRWAGPIPESSPLFPKTLRAE